MARRTSTTETSAVETETVDVPEETETVTDVTEVTEETPDQEEVPAAMSTEGFGALDFADDIPEEEIEYSGRGRSNPNKAPFIKLCKELANAFINGEAYKRRIKYKADKERQSFVNWVKAVNEQFDGSDDYKAYEVKHQTGTSTGGQKVFAIWVEDKE